MDTTERFALEKKRMEMRLRSQRLEKERRALLKLAVHNSAIQKANKYGIQWEDLPYCLRDDEEELEFHEEDFEFCDEDFEDDDFREKGSGADEAGEARVGGLTALWHHLDVDDDEEEDDDDLDWECEAVEGGSSDEWTDLTSSVSGGGTGSDEREVSDGPSGGSSEDVREVSEEESPVKRQTSDEWTDCSTSAGDETSGGDEAEAGSSH